MTKTIQEVQQQPRPEDKSVGRRKQNYFFGDQILSERNG